MLNIKGSAAVEMVWVILFFFALLTVVQRFSLMATDASRLSVGLQNRVEQIMIDSGRPPCLEEIGDGFVSGKGRAVSKRLVYVTRPICGGR